MNGKKSSGFRDAALILLVTAVLIVLLDVACRIAFTFHDNRPDPRAQADAYTDTAWAESYFEEQRVSADMRWEPYVYWRRNAFSGTHINVDGWGIRKSWQPPDADVDALPAIMMFGGSTLWGTGADDHQTIPSHVNRLLHEGGNSYRMENLGETGYVSTQNLVLLMRLLQDGHRPEMVVFYDGVNDVYSALQHGRAGLPSNEYNRIAEFNLLLDKGRLYRTALGRFASGGIVRVMRHFFGKTATGPYDSATVAREAVDVYIANARLATALADAYGFTPIFVWQPVIFTKPERTDYEQAQYQAEAQAAEFYHHANGYLERLLPGLSDIHLLNLADVFENTPAPVYIDFCHLSPEGNRIVAKRIVEYLEGLE